MFAAPPSAATTNYRPSIALLNSPPSLQLHVGTNEPGMNTAVQTGPCFTIPMSTSIRVVSGLLVHLFDRSI